MKSNSSRNLQIMTIGLIVVGVLVLSLSGFLGEVVGRALDPVVGAQSWIATRFQAVVDFFTAPRDVASLTAKNTQLENEVSQLQSQIIQLKQQLSESEVLYSLLDFARERPENKYVAASVIGRDPSPFLHYVIIDHGSDDGIQYGMPVVTQQGLVGRVDAVTAGAARVQLITDPGSAVNIRLEKAGVEGQAVGSVTGDISLAMVGLSAELSADDLVLTSGLGGDYPADILVGQLLTPSHELNSLFQSAAIQPVVDFSKLRAVLIITNFTPVDIAPLTPATTQ
ncbi:MAG TPA: rod shape-determining protein MreC [Anaerolineaceae bacterium]|jgi:rod shape-determining protein MreC|nr:rod shape-determining protein MreC [Anaerolineaceae bacterium]